MEATRDLHRLIGKVPFRIAKDIFHNAAPFNTTNDVFNHYPNTRYDLVLGFFLACELFAFRLFLGLIGLDTFGFIPLKARVFEQPTTGWKNWLFVITNAFVMDTARIRLTQIAHETIFNIANEVVFNRMLFFYHYTGLFAQADRLDAEQASRFHQWQNRLSDKAPGLVPDSEGLVPVNIGLLQERPLRWG